ncbi:MAG: hypothetical protein J7L38_02560 [Thermoproteales archaeon]|nr:hypothetical protein [Thermoproteales archaeon]
MQMNARKIGDKLSSLGFEVDVNAVVRGIAGFNYKFDLIVENPSTRKRAIVIFLDKLDSRHVIPLLALRYDLDTQHVILAKQVEADTELILNEAGFKVIKISCGQEDENLAKRIACLLR